MINNAHVGQRVSNAIFGKATIIKVSENELSFWLDEPLYGGKEKIIVDSIDNDMWENIKGAHTVDVSSLPVNKRTTMEVYPSLRSTRLFII